MIQFKHTGDSHQPQPMRPPLRLLSDAAILRLPEPQWLVDKLCPEQSLTMLYGSSGHGKTFVALDLAFSIATGRPFHGQAVEQGNVVYLYAEGVHGLPQRIKAWKTFYGVECDDPTGVFFLPSRVDLAGDGEPGVDVLLEMIESQVPGEVELLVVDTLARCFGGCNEDATQDMNRFTARCDRVREQLQCGVMVIHHTGWSADRERGNKCLRSNSDTIIKCSMNHSDHITLECEKQRDGRHFDSIKLELQEVELPGGKTSCVPRPLGLAGEVTAKLGADAIAVLAALGSFDPPGAEFTEWYESIDGISNSTFKRRRTALVDSGFVNGPPEKAKDTKGFKYTLTPRGKELLESERGQSKLNPNPPTNGIEAAAGVNPTSPEVASRQELKGSEVVGSPGGGESPVDSGSGVGAHRAPPEPERPLSDPETKPPGPPLRCKLDAATNGMVELNLGG